MLTVIYSLFQASFHLLLCSLRTAFLLLPLADEYCQCFEVYAALNAHLLEGNVILLCVRFGYEKALSISESQIRCSHHHLHFN